MRLLIALQLFLLCACTNGVIGRNDPEEENVPDKDKKEYVANLFLSAQSANGGTTDILTSSSFKVNEVSVGITANSVISSESYVIRGGSLAGL